MSDKRISYLNKTFDDYRQALIDYTRAYYPDIASSLDDASVGTWFIELLAAMGDNLSYYIDKAYNETNIESARFKSSVYSLARSNGLKIPGPKPAITELKFTCRLPVSVADNSNSPSTLGMPNWKYAPIIRKGTRVRSQNGHYFETTEDLNFTEQFNSEGESNRDIIPYTDSNNRVAYYEVSKTCSAIAGISKIYKMVIPNSSVKPFMEVIIPDRNVINVESILVKDGDDFQNEPCTKEFMMPFEYLKGDGNGITDTYRFFEVDSLAQPYMWADDVVDYLGAEAKTYEFSYALSTENSYKDVPVTSITKGKWLPLTQKFITEYTDNGYLKVIFGSGTPIGQDVDTSDATFSTQNQISRMVNNGFLGKLPMGGATLFILYRIGGGAESNVPKGTINSISYLDAVNATPPDNANKTLASSILASITVINTIPSVSGKDAPSVDELKNMIKYNSAAQNRCVTVKDYHSRILNMPSRYGCPFRLSVLEENNKIMVYLLMVDSSGKLSATVPSTLITNIENYLSMYKSVNDFVEIKPGRIINVSFEIDIYIAKNYESNDVIKNVRAAVQKYMDINNHALGEDIYVSDLEKEVSNVDGVSGIIDFRAYNEYGDGYSRTTVSQETVSLTDTTDEYYNVEEGRSQIDLSASDYILNSETDEMFEIKYPDNDITIRAKIR